MKKGRNDIKGIAQPYWLTNSFPWRVIFKDTEYLVERGKLFFFSFVFFSLSLSLSIFFIYLFLCWFVDLFIFKGWGSSLGIICNEGSSRETVSLSRPPTCPCRSPSRCSLRAGFVTIPHPREIWLLRSRVSLWFVMKVSQSIMSPVLAQLSCKVTLIWFSGHGTKVAARLDIEVVVEAETTQQHTRGLFLDVGVPLGVVYLVC